MSIATAIANAQARVEAAYDALEAKGATMPATQNLANMPNAIQSIQTGGDESALLVTIKGETGTDITLPSGLNATRALDGLFYGNTKVKYVTIPSNITRVGLYAFYAANNLLRVNSNTDGVCNLWEGITELADYCFYSCSKLTSVIFPSTLKTIKTSIFNSCGKLVSADFSRATLVTSFGSYLFANCPSFTTMIWPPNITQTGTHTFLGCSSLTSIRIPDTITKIGASCFYLDNNLLEIDFGNTRSSVPTLENINAFYTTNQTTIADRKIIVPDALYDSWIAATNWKNTNYGIKNQIIRYSDYYV